MNTQNASSTTISLGTNSSAQSANSSPKMSSSNQQKSSSSQSPSPAASGGGGEASSLEGLGTLGVAASQAASLGMNQASKCKELSLLFLASN